ncbi:TPA: hypothetical protein N0F65_006516, partial [Lagenidium giganteum]
HKQLPKQLWKLAKTREQLSVYKVRRTARHRQRGVYSTGIDEQCVGNDIPDCASSVSSEESFRTAPSAMSDDGSERRNAYDSSASVPTLVAVGSVAGTLDDVMLGWFGNDDASWRVRSSYIKDGLEGSRLLATLEVPNAQDPFRSLCIKWFTKEHPSALKSLIGIVRGRLSFCFLARDEVDASGQTGKQVDIFTRGFSDPQGDMPERISTMICAEAMLSVANVVDCAFTRKLVAAMAKNKHTLPSVHGEKAEEHCQACNKRVNRFGSFLSGSACQICREMVCTRCSVTRKITVDVSSVEMIQRPMPFCITCVIAAKQVSSWDVAMNEFVRPSRLTRVRPSSSAKRILTDRIMP